MWSSPSPQTTSSNLSDDFCDVASMVEHDWLEMAGRFAGVDDLPESLSGSWVDWTMSKTGHVWRNSLMAVCSWVRNCTLSASTEESVSLLEGKNQSINQSIRKLFLNPYLYECITLIEKRIRLPDTAKAESIEVGKGRYTPP